MKLGNIYHQGVKDGIELMWKIVQDIDATQPQYPMPFELFRRYRTAVGKEDDYLMEHGGNKDGKDDVFRD